MGYLKGNFASRLASIEVPVGIREETKEKIRNLTGALKQLAYKHPRFGYLRLDQRLQRAGWGSESKKKCIAYIDKWDSRSR